MDTHLSAISITRNQLSGSMFLRTIDGRSELAIGPDSVDIIRHEVWKLANKYPAVGFDEFDDKLLDVENGLRHETNIRQISKLLRKAQILTDKFLKDNIATKTVTDLALVPIAPEDIYSFLP